MNLEKINKCNYVYGPIPSRRLGFSLGIDLVPYKICSLDCIYCQLGKTTEKSIERKSYIPKDVLLKEITDTLKKNIRINFITFSGSGEPTLNSEIGLFVKEIKKITTLPIAVLTNGTLLFREDVQKDLLAADVVLPSLDAASQDIFEQINNPHDSLHIKTIINGLKNFRSIYKGRIWLEIMLVKDINDAYELLNIQKALSEINPDEVHLNTVVRPPSELYAEPIRYAELLFAKRILAENAQVIHPFHRKKTMKGKDTIHSIMDMAKRRPLTIMDIADVLGISSLNAQKMVDKLKTEGKLKEKEYRGKEYYSLQLQKTI